MSISPKIYCVIPAFNEAKNIGPVLRELKPVVDRIIVVSDGSIDDTDKIVKDEDVFLLRHLTNRGQGAALRTGTRYAFEDGADIVVHFDADGQFLVTDIATAVEPIIAGRADVVFGSRFLSAKTEMPRFKEKVIMPTARLVNDFFWGIKLTDPQSGFRVFRASLFPQLHWRQDGMAHCSEILYLAHAPGIRVEEVPITVIYHHFGQKISGGVRIMKDFFISKLIY